VLDRAFGVIFAFYTVLLVGQVAVSATGRGSRLLVDAPNAVQPVMAAVLCALLLVTSVRASRGPLPEPLVVGLLVATALTILIARLSSGTGPPVDDTLYELAGPGLTAWTVHPSQPGRRPRRGHPCVGWRLGPLDCSAG